MNKCKTNKIKGIIRFEEKTNKMYTKPNFVNTFPNGNMNKSFTDFLICAQPLKNRIQGCCVCSLVHHNPSITYQKPWNVFCIDCIMKQCQLIQSISFC
jgi:hypothetical protein